jgi:glycine/D-amino acid oxidase-like deaminating enzyme
MVSRVEISHHGVRTELPDEWWIAAGMPNFVPAKSAYRCDHAAAGGRRVCLIQLMDIGPVRRAPGVPVFNAHSWEGISARERVERILRAFVVNGALPPVELTKQAGRYPFSLKDGLHRVYCSIAAGFTEIPAIKFIDPDAGRDIEELC